MDNTSKQSATLLVQSFELQQEQQQQHYMLYVMAIVSTSFWVVIWVMHLCALTNAKMKFNKRSYLLASNKRKTKTQPERFYDNEKRDHPKQQQFVVGTNGTNGTLLPKDQQHQAQHKKPLFSNDNHDQKQQQLLIESQQQHLEINNIDVTNDSLYYPTKPENHDNDWHDCNKVISNNSRITMSCNDSTKQLYNYNDYYFYINLPLPGVSVIKPLVGVDRNLFYNLETFFHMDYPIYELLFCVQDPNDAAILVVEELFKKYPKMDAKLFIGGSRVGVNPKINNMQPAYEAVKYELLLISDSGISMRPDTLLDMVAYMNDDVALVHQMPFVNCHGRNNFQDIVERVYFGTAHARAYLTADLLNINCPTGMSALMRKCLLDEVGGIKAFGQYLAEDFFFAKSFTERGWKICISSQPALQNSANSSDTLNTLNLRIQRWIKLRFAMVPQWTLLEPFSECMLIGLLGATSISFLWALNPFIVFLLHVLLWFLFDYKLLCTIQNGPLTCTKTDFLLAWLVRECTALLVFLKALADPKVTWRSREFKLRWGGYTEEVALSDTS